MLRHCKKGLDLSEMTDAFPWKHRLSQEERDYLWMGGDLTWKLHTGQLAIEDSFESSPGKLFVLDCSRQLGKSTWAVTKAIECALREPGSRIRYATAFLTDLEQFIVPTFDSVLEDCPKNQYPEFSVQKSEFRFRNGSKIRLIGLDRKPNGLRGNKLRLVILDEAGYISRLSYLYQSVLIPATTHVSNARIIMASTQPEEADHDFIGFCNLAQEENSYIKLDVYSCPMLSPRRIVEIARDMGGIDSTAFRREYLCHRVVEEGRAIVPEFDEARHVRLEPPGPAHHFWIRVASLDSGVRDLTACLFAYYDFQRAKLVIEDEFAITGHQVTTRRIAELVREREALLGWPGVYRRTADNDNLILLQDLGQEFGLHFNPTNKDDLVAMVNKVRLWMKAGRIEIHPKCVRLIGTLKAGVWNEKRTEFARSKVHGHYDLLASLVYLVRNCPEHENPVPEFFNQNLSEVFYQLPRKETGAAAGFKKAFVR